MMTIKKEEKFIREKELVMIMIVQYELVQENNIADWAEKKWLIGIKWYIKSRLVEWIMLG